MSKAELTISILTNVLFISIFIVLFFFSYGSYIEKKVVINQMDFLSLSVADLIKHSGPEGVKKFKEVLNTTQPPNLDDADKKVSESNKEIFKKAMYANLFLVAITSIIVFGIYMYDRNVNITHILIQNSIILFFVALVEMYFLTFIAGKFISIDPNRVKYKVLENINKKLKK